MNELFQFFHYAHLPQHLQAASIPFYNLAIILDGVLPNNSEKEMAFRKLLEAKDCAVRAIVHQGSN